MLVKLLVGIVFVMVVGLVVGYVIVWVFKCGKVLEYMKVLVLFVGVLGVFVVLDVLFYESGLFVVMVMGVYFVNVDLLLYVEL